MRVNIDRQRAADLGVPVTAIGSALETMMGSRRVTTFVDNGEEYDVLVQAGRDGRASPADLAAIRVRATSGELVPLSNLVTLSEVAEAGTLNRFNRLRSITITAGLAPGYPLGEAIAWAQNVAREELPQYAQVNWKGESREYQSAGGAVLLTFAMALLVVYLVLAAQFESFIHPLTIMLTVPLGVLGALVGLWVSGGTVNLFSQIGIVMLVGLAAKNGILIVEFANQLRDDGRTVREAIIESAMVRLRPILMTSIATVVGAIPLVVAGGPGSASRGTIGIVIIFGVTLSTFLSLFVVPAFYARLAPHPLAGSGEARAGEAGSRIALGGRACLTGLPAGRTRVGSLSGTERALTPPLQGEGFRLRPWRPEDLESLLRHANDAEVSRGLRDRFPYPYTREDGEAFLAGRVLALAR